MKRSSFQVSCFKFSEAVSTNLKPGTRNQKLQPQPIRSIQLDSAQNPFRFRHSIHSFHDSHPRSISRLKPATAIETLYRPSRHTACWILVELMATSNEGRRDDDTGDHCVGAPCRIGRPHLGHRSQYPSYRPSLPGQPTRWGSAGAPQWIQTT